MGWLDLFRSGETRSAGNDTLAALGATWLGEGRGSSRYPAESLAVVQACVAAISGHLAGLPVAVYERRGEERIEASAHPFAGLFRRGPNAWQSWPEFVEWLAASALLAGNGLAEVVSDGAGRVTELRPIPWGLVRVERAPVGRVIYHVTGDDLSGRRGTTRRLLPSEVIHLRCRTDDGIVGVAPLRRAAAAADMAIEVDAHTRETWRNSGRPGGVLMHEKAISEAAASRLRTNWIDRYGGEGAGKPAVLEEGMKFEPFPTISPEDAELLAARRYSGEELARIYQVPPPMIGDLTHGTFANTEQLLRYFAISTLAGWARRLETALSRGVLTREERSRFEIDVSLDGLLRGSAAERAQDRDRRRRARSRRGARSGRLEPSREGGHSADGGVVRTYAGIARRLGLAERDVRRVAEELELCGYRAARPVRLGKRDVLAIRTRADGGETVKSIADSTGLAFGQVRRIVERESWTGPQYEPESAGPFITAGRPV